MTVDVAVIGAPFLDITFEGLERIPEPGEELVARALHVSPGGTGMQAIGCARLGLRTALIASLPASGAEGLMRNLLEREGVAVAMGPGTIPVTALLSTPEGTAMATVMDGVEPSAADVARVEPRAVLCSLGRIDLAPPGTRVYAVTGTLELEVVAADLERRMQKADTLILNAAEAARLTGTDEPEAAAMELAAARRTVVVTRGADGAISARDGAIERAAAPEVTVEDATGAGDLFAAAYVWADTAIGSRALEWACLYAGLSVRTATALDGALGLDGFMTEARARGLSS